jgi:hypothetical protein
LVTQVPEESTGKVKRKMRCDCLPRSVLAVAIVVATVMMFLFHYAPLIDDEFSVVKNGADYHKVFRHGWPLRYISQGPLSDTEGTIALRIGINFLLIAAFVCAGGFVAHKVIENRRK